MARLWLASLVAVSLSLTACDDLLDAFRGFLLEEVEQCLSDEWYLYDHCECQGEPGYCDIPDPQECDAPAYVCRVRGAFVKG